MPTRSAVPTIRVLLHVATGKGCGRRRRGGALAAACAQDSTCLRGISPYLIDFERTSSPSMHSELLDGMRAGRQNNRHNVAAWQVRWQGREREHGRTAKVEGSMRRVRGNRSGISAHCERVHGRSAARGGGAASPRARADCAWRPRCSAARGIDAFRAELPGILDAGVTPVELREVVYQAVDYVGIGRALPFVNRAGRGACGAWRGASARSAGHCCGGRSPAERQPGAG